MSGEDFARLSDGERIQMREELAPYGAGIGAALVDHGAGDSVSILEIRDARTLQVLERFYLPSAGDTCGGFMQAIERLPVSPFDLDQARAALERAAEERAWDRLLHGVANGA